MEHLKNISSKILQMFPRINALAYVVADEDNVLYNIQLTPGVNVVKLFSFVTDDEA